MLLRRRALVAALLGGSGAIAGCLSGAESEIGSSPTVSSPPTASHTTAATASSQTGEQQTSTPDEWAQTFHVFAVNATDEEQSIEVVIERAGEQVVADRVDVQAGDETPTTIEEFETAGEYTITAETADHRGEETVEVRRHYLEDCNRFEVAIIVSDSEILLQPNRTQAGCDPE